MSKLTLIALGLTGLALIVGDRTLTLIAGVFLIVVAVLGFAR